MNPDEVAPDVPQNPQGPTDADKARIAKNVQTMQSKGAQDSEVEDYLTNIEHLRPVTATDPMAGYHAAYQKGLLGNIEQGKSADEASALPTKVGATLETLETPLAGVPGGALAMSAARKLTSPSQTFASTQADVNRGVSDVPYASALGRMVGGVSSIGALPGATGLKAGAMLGGADQLANNDPHSGAVARIVRGMGGAAVGGALGGLTDAAITGTRALMAPGASEAVQAAQGARSEANASTIGPSYTTAGGQAERYLATYKSPPELTAALAHPEIAPYVKAIKGTELGKTLNDAQVGEEAYKMMSELQGKKLTISTNGESTPATDFQVRALGKVKDVLKQGLAAVEPDFPEAVATHAEMSQPITAMKEGYNAARQTLGGPVPAKALGIPAKDPAAYLNQAVPKLAPDQARAAVLGVLSRTKGNIGLSPNPLTAFGVGKSATAVNRIQPLINALDQQGGNGLPSSLRNVLLALAQGQETP